MSLKLHFPEAGWKTVQQAWADRWAGELDRPPVVLECVEPGDEHTLTTC